MGFGKKTYFESGRSIDLDKVYRVLIKPTVEAKGLECVRADEIRHAGVIDVPMYQELLSADFVIADISTANANAIYELGIRHALRRNTTIVISENQLKYPFDLNHVLIFSYAYLDGGGIDYEEVLRFQKRLGDLIDDLRKHPKTDSPVYTYLKTLNPPTPEKELERVADRVQEAASAAKAAAPAAEAPEGGGDDPTLSGIIDLGEKAIRDSRFADAKSFFAAALGVCRTRAAAGVCPHTVDPYLTQRLALATYKEKEKDPDAAVAVRALNEALEVLRPLDLAASNDPETVGLAGAIEKRLFDRGAGPEHLDRAARYHARGYYLRDDYYNGINLAYLLTLRTTTPLDPTDAEKIAVLVFANRIRREVLANCDRVLQAIEARKDKAAQPPAGATPAAAAVLKEQTRGDWEQLFWYHATKAEAHLGLGDLPAFEAARARALAITPPPAQWMVDTLDAQIKRLRDILQTHGRLLDPPWPANPLPAAAG